MNEIINLSGVVFDDGLPSITLISTWRLISGPGSITFGDSFSATTTATLDTAGTYILQLTADDDELFTIDEIIITVI